jgi:hypothetical protein
MAVFTLGTGVKPLPASNLWQQPSIQKDFPIDAEGRMNVCIDQDQNMY